MSTYVSDWSQEVYGDVRSWAVPGASASTRRDYLNDYLQHKLVLAGVGPPTIETARSYLQSAYSPLANAAWERDIPDTAGRWSRPSRWPATCRRRSTPSATSAREEPERRPLGVRVGAEERVGHPRWQSSPPRPVRSSIDSVRPSATPARTVDPEISEAPPVGRRGRTSGAWATSTALASTRPGSRSGCGRSRCCRSPAPQTIPAGTASSAMSLALPEQLRPTVDEPTPLAVTLSSSSPRAAFSTSSTESLVDHPGADDRRGHGCRAPASTTSTRAPGALLTASRRGSTSGTQTVTVTPGPLASVVVSPHVHDRSRRARSSALGRRHGRLRQRAPVSPTWSLTPPTVGKISPRGGRTTTLTTFRATGRARSRLVVSSGRDGLRCRHARVARGSRSGRSRTDRAGSARHCERRRLRRQAGIPCPRIGPHPTERSGYASARARHGRRREPSSACHYPRAAASEPRSGEFLRRASSGTAARRGTGSASLVSSIAEERSLERLPAGRFRGRERLENRIRPCSIRRERRRSRRPVR